VEGAMQQHLCFLVSGQDVDPSTFLHQGDAQAVRMKMLIDVSQMPTDQVVWLTYPILVTHPAHPIRKEATRVTVPHPEWQRFGLVSMKTPRMARKLRFALCIIAVF